VCSFFSNLDLRQSGVWWVMMDESYGEDDGMEVAEWIALSTRPKLNQKNPCWRSKTIKQVTQIHSF